MFRDGDCDGVLDSDGEEGDGEEENPSSCPPRGSCDDTDDDVDDVDGTMDGLADDGADKNDADPAGIGWRGVDDDGGAACDACDARVNCCNSFMRCVFSLSLRSNSSRILRSSSDILEVGGGAEVNDATINEDDDGSSDGVDVDDVGDVVCGGINGCDGWGVEA